MRLGLVLLTGLACFAAVSVRAEETVDVNGTPLNLVSEDGFCRLSDQDPKQHAALDKMREVQNAATNLLLAWYLKCDTLQQANQGNAPDTSESIQILVNKLQGAVRRLPIPRDTYIEQAIKELGGIDPAKVGDMVRGRLGKTGLNIELGQMKSLGVIERDQTAAYAGLMQHVASGQNDTYIASVIGFTEIQGYPVNVDFFGRFVDQGTIDALLRADKDYLERLVAANDSGKAFGALPANPPAFAGPVAALAPANAGAEPQHTGIDWGQVFVAGVVGALIGAAIYATRLVLRRRQ